MQISNGELLRDIALQLRQFILPDLSSGDAIERASFSALMLDQISGRLDVLEQSTGNYVGPYLEQLRTIVDSLAGDYPGHLLEAESRESPVEQLFALRELTVLLIRDEVSISDRERGELLRLDAQWRAHLGQALAKTVDEQAASRKGDAEGKTVYDRITAVSMTDYLRANIDGAAELEVTEVEILPGGRSKHTVFLSIAGTEALPAEVVMRQDTGKANIPTYIGDEYPVLKSAYNCGVPVAQPLYLEPDKTHLGGAFMLSRKLGGKTPGDYFNFAAGNRELTMELARTLGNMHALDVSTIQLPASRVGDHREYMLAQIDYYRKQWQNNALEQSPIIEYAFAWLDRECRSSVGGPALVHGDIAPHNYLADGGRLTGIVDWEFAHIGDPAEDLGYRRQLLSQYLPWEEFLDLYYQQGAAPIDERRLQMFEVWGLLRNAAFGALGHRQYQTGAHLDYIEAAMSTFLYDFFDNEVARVLAL